jgi:tetratricopeptide (TPR) repeat protein
MVLAAAALALGLAPATVRAGTNAQIGVEQAKVLFSDNDYEGALSLLKDALAEEPENGEALQYAGLCELGLKRPAEAVDYLEKAAARMPQDPGVQEDLAWAALAAERYDLALSASDRALAAQPDRARATLYKGQALLGLKRNEEALGVLGNVDLSTQYAQAANYYSGAALLGLGRTEEAKGFFQKAQSLGPETEVGKKSGEYLETLGGVGGPAKKDWSARVRLLYQYDSNIVTANNEDFLPEDITHMADSRAVLDADLAYRFIDTDSGRATVRYLGYASWHAQESEMNLMYNLGELSGYRLLPLGERKAKLGLIGNYAFAALDNDPYSSYWNVIPYAELMWNKSLVTGLDVDFMGEAFDEPGLDENNRDNTRIHVTLRQHFLLADNKVAVMVAYRCGQITAEGENYNRIDNGGLAGVNLALPRKSLASVLVRFDDRDYPDNFFDRHERLLTANASFQTPIYQALNLYASVVYANVDSNLELLEYDRWIFSLGLLAEL